MVKEKLNMKNKVLTTEEIEEKRIKEEYEKRSQTLHPYFEELNIQDAVSMMDFGGQMVIYDTRSESYIYINNKSCDQNTTNMHGIETNVDDDKIQYLSKAQTAKLKVEDLIKQKFKDIQITKEVKKIISDNIPYGELRYDLTTQKIVYEDKNTGTTIFNSCRLPEHFYIKEEVQNTMEDFVENTLPNKFKEFDVLLNNLFNDNREDIKYFLNWLGSSFKGKKNLTSCIISGVQGSGKGVLMNYIEWYFGKNNVLTASNELLTSQFNEQMEDKIFINLNEITLNKNRVLYEKLKMWITDNKYNLNVKGIRQRTKANNFNILITTNNEAPIEVSQTDRRYNIFKTKEQDLKKIVDTKTYYKDLEASFEDFTTSLKKVSINYEKADSALQSKLKETIADTTTTKKEMLMNMINKKDFDKMEDYKEVFIDNKIFNKTTNETNFQEMVNDLEIAGKVKNSIAIWLYKVFVDEEASLVQVGKDFNLFIGEVKEGRINGKKYKFRQIKELVNKDKKIQIKPNNENSPF